MPKVTRVSKAEWIENKDNEKKALENQLGSFLKSAIETKDGMDALTAHYRISGLYNYSFFNSILINMQGGTIAQSYNKWKAIKRIVTKGEKSNISIFRPMFTQEKDTNGIEKEKLIGFKLAPVFDLKQTDGEPLEYDHNSAECMDVTYAKVSKVLGALTGAEVAEEITGNARGYSDGTKLVVSSMSNDTDKTKTLIHEAAHHLVHTGKDKAEKVSRETMEVEAESVAYLVLSYLGLDYDLSKQYVKGYQAGIQGARHGLIIRTSDKIIKALKKEMTDEEQFLVAIA
jgi:hypothetical protein